MDTQQFQEKLKKMNDQGMDALIKQANKKRAKNKEEHENVQEAVQETVEEQVTPASFELEEMIPTSNEVEEEIPPTFLEQLEQELAPLTVRKLKRLLGY